MSRSLAPAHFEVSTAPTTSLVDLDTLKRELRISGTVEDDRLNRIISSVDYAVEEYLRRPVRAQSVRYLFDDYPCGNDSIHLPRTPISAITSVEALSGGVWGAVSAADYDPHHLHTSPSPPRAEVILDATVGGWDLDVDDVRYPFRVTAASGWATVPDGIVDAAYRIAQSMNVHKGVTADVRMFMVGGDIRRVLDQYRRDETAALSRGVF